MYAGKFLSYTQFGKAVPGRVRLQSAGAKRPMTWNVRNISGNRLTLEAVRCFYGILRREEKNIEYIRIKSV